MEKLQSPQWLQVSEQTKNLTPSGRNVYERYAFTFYDNGLLQDPDQVEHFCHMCNGWAIYQQSKDSQEPMVQSMAASMFATIKEKAQAMGIEITKSEMRVLIETFNN